MPKPRTLDERETTITVVSGEQLVRIYTSWWADHAKLRGAGVKPRRKANGGYFYEIPLSWFHWEITEGIVDVSTKRFARQLVQYGITPQDWEEMYHQQNGACAICEKPYPKEVLKRNVLERVPRRLLHVDHNHRTGKVRGLLCQFCNTRLGTVEQKAWVIRAQAYLAGAWNGTPPQA